MVKALRIKCTVTEIVTEIVEIEIVTEIPRLRSRVYQSVVRSYLEGERTYENVHQEHRGG